MSEHGEADDDLDRAGTGAAESATGSRKEVPLDELLDRLDSLGDLDDLSGGGVGGLATGIEILTDGFVHGPDDLLDSFEPARDLADGTDVFEFDELF